MAPVIPAASATPVAPIKEAAAPTPAAESETSKSDSKAKTSAQLEISDGRRITIFGKVLVGRNPAAREGETADDTISVADKSRSVSKTHLSVEITDGVVWVEDRKSMNGTVVTLPDDEQIILGGGQRVKVPVGASVAFGGASFKLLEIS